MAAGPEMLDVITGLPISSSYNQRYPALETSNTSTSGRTDTQRQTTQTQTNQRQTTTQNILNTTPAALQALESLIQQLSDRPAISEAELFAKAPNASPVYTRNGWLYTDPLTGRRVSESEVVGFNQKRSAERQQLQQQAGVIRGGTESQRETETQRKSEIDRTRKQQGDYSKDAAFSDAQFLIDKAISDALEKAMPEIVAASEGAGTSKSTFRGLAVEKAAERGAIEGGALGAQLSVGYGQIWNQLESMLVEMTKQDPNSQAAMLLQALQASKGMVQSGTTDTNVSSQQTGQSQAQTQVGPSSQQTNTTRQYNIDGAAPGAPSGLPNVMASSSGALASPAAKDVPTFDTEQAYQYLLDEQDGFA